MTPHKHLLSDQTVGLRFLQRGNPHLFVVPPVLQGNNSIPRSRLLVFAARGLVRGSFSAKPGVLRKQTPGFCAARAAIERLLKRFSCLDAETGGFLMARARIIFRGTAGNSGDFGSGFLLKRRSRILRRRTRQAALDKPRVHDWQWGFCYTRALLSVTAANRAFEEEQP